MASRHASDPGPIDRDEAGHPSSVTLGPLATPSIYSASGFSRKGGLALRNFSFNRRPTAASRSSSEDGWGPTGLNLLHSPQDPLLDLVFVHGLRGGSIKTWCKNDDPQLYWPQAWLPRDPDLPNVRIHSFGYNSDWGESKETSLDLHDFGRSLLAELTTSPELRKGDKTPILLIGHSMGGLVMKKAYILAQQDDRYHDFAQRIQCMFFLATPHRGSDSAKLLNSVLRASAFLSPKQYIVDIGRNSGALSVINDEFRFVSEALEIWSFYETVKTRLGTNSVMIVERDSAIIGNRREHVHPINADHRGICKFDSPSDPNYISIRNSLVKATEDLIGEVFHERSNESRYQTNMLEAYLNISHDPEDDLNTIEGKKTQGSCEWVTDLGTFAEWRETEPAPILCHWLSGQAGAGKSVLAAHIVRHLQEQGLDTCYFFFRHGQKAKQTTSSLLRSLAFQMASLHPSVRKVLFGMRESGVLFDKDDERAIWRKLFLTGVLTVPIDTKQYWVIDGLDECVDAGKLLQLLFNFEARFQVRVHFTSRRLPELEKHLTRLESRLLRHHIEAGDTLRDIQQFIEENSDDLPVDPESRPALIEKLIEKSDGAFLWIKLAFEELGKIYSEDEIDEVLEQVPVGMTPMYNRILDTMANNGRQVKLMKAIVEWAVCGTRPLHIDELQAALTLDLKTKVRNVERVVEDLCGQLFKVDGHGLVQVLHATARDFLLGIECNSIFRVDKAEANQRLAIVCLTYLTSEEMRPPRHPALLGKTNARSVFVDYACTSFSEHILSASSTSDEMFLLLDRFFRTNVLSWVEYILKRKRNLYYLSRASKNLRKYLDRRAKYASPLGQQYRNIEMWQVDLLRIALKFGDNLIRDPSCIYFLVPPLCPIQTGISQQFAHTPNGLRLSGLTNDIWDDCVCYIDYRQSRALSLAGGDGLFAIGMKSGAINIHHQTTCQQIRSLGHGEPVKLLRFDDGSQHIASAGFKHLRMWTIDGDLLWAIRNPSPLSTMAFTGDGTLVTVDRHGKVNTLDVKTGLPAVDSHRDEPGEKNSPGHNSWQVILDADICPNTELLAIGYRGRPPQIWSIEQGVMIGTCHMRRDKPDVPIMSISELLFNPNPAVELLAVAYQDGELAIFDKWPGGHEIKAVSADALTLAASSDGRTLATGDAIGTIKLWDFETLTLLYCIKSSEHEVKWLAFSGDGFRLYDIRDTKTKVWEPSVLGGKAVTEESSVSESVAAPVPIIGRDKEVVDITQILAPHQAEAIFVGKDDGSVAAYDPATGKVLSNLYSHRRDIFVTLLSWNQSMIASTDVSGTTLLYTLEKAPSHGWLAKEKLFELSHTDSTINQILLHPTRPLLLVSQPDSVKLFDVNTAAELPSLPPCGGSKPYTSWNWLNQELGEMSLLLGVSEHQIDMYLLKFGCDGEIHGVSSVVAVHIKGPDDAPITGKVKRTVIDSEDKYLVVELEPASSTGSAGSPKVAVYPTKNLIIAAKEKISDPSSQTEHVTEQPILIIQSGTIKTLFGFHGSDTLVFLDHNLWVRSIDLSKIPKHTSKGCDSRSVELLADRHFFIPREFIGANNGVDGLVTPDHGTIVFPKEGELAVVRNALEWTFTVSGTGNPVSGTATGKLSRQRKGSENGALIEEKGEEGEKDDDFDITALRRRITGNITI
ncbi:hypothetical protein V8F20_001826 [Naviculisporaceae sp. PSN 640]